MIMKEEAESLKKEVKLLKETLNTKNKMLRINIAENEMKEKKESMVKFCIL